MSEYQPPCATGNCPDRSNISEIDNVAVRLCKSMSDCIISAGGAGVLETTICPMGALAVLGPEQEDPHMAEIRAKLGIVGYYEAMELD